MAITDITIADRLRWLRNPPMTILRKPDVKLPSGATGKILKASNVAKATLGPAGAVLGFITAFYSSIGFALFILEESIQQAGFGIFAIQQSRHFERMPHAILRYRQLINSLGKLIEKVDVFFGLQIDLTELSDDDRDLVGPFLDSTGTMGRDTILEPYIHFYNAARFNADEYEALAASKIKGVNKQLNAAIEQIAKESELDKFKLKQAHDERVDNLAIQKAQRADELKQRKAEENAEFVQDAKVGSTRETTDKLQFVRRLLDDELEKVQRKLTDNVQEVIRGLDSELERIKSSARQNLEALNSQESAELKPLFEKHAEDWKSLGFPDWLDPAAVEAWKIKEKEMIDRHAAETSEITNNFTLLKRTETQAREDEKDSFRIAAEEEKQRLKEEAEDDRDAQRKDAEEEMQRIREEAKAAGQATGMTAREKATAKLAITKKYDALDIKLKLEFDERGRGEAEVNFNAMQLMEKIRENREQEARILFYPLPEETGIIEGIAPEEITAKVISVVDGDTFDIAGTRVRMLGIDTAEHNTAQGTLDTAFTKSLIDGKEVKILSDQSNQFDGFGRLLGVIHVGTLNVNLEILRKCHAMPLFLGPNKQVNPDQYLAAFRECAVPPPIPPTSDSGEEGQLPTPAPEPIPQTISIIIIAELENGTRINGLKVFWDSKARETEGSGIMEASWNKGQATTLSIKAPSGYLILPTLLDSASISIDALTDYTTTFLLRAITAPAPAPAPAPEPLPGDNNGISGAAASVDFGFLDPPRALGDGGNATTNIIINKRTFTLAEVADTSHEILSVRLNLTGPFTNSVALDADYKLLRPDGTVLTVPESAAEIIQTPSSQGFKWWNWAKFGAVFNGIGGDLTGKGRYKLTILIDGGNPPSGQYELSFDVI